MIFSKILYVIYECLLLFCAVMACINYKSLRANGLGILLPFLVYTLIQEWLLFSLVEMFHVLTSSAIFYNIYRPLTILVTALLYYSVPFLRNLRGFIIGITIFMLLLYAVNYLFLEHFTTTSSYITILRGLAVTAFCILFLYHYFNLDNREEEFFWRPLLWVTIGMVVFYPVTSIVFTFSKFLAAKEATLFGMKLYQVIPQLMSIFMYSCFCYAFYLCKKKK